MAPRPKGLSFTMAGSGTALRATRIKAFCVYFAARRFLFSMNSDTGWSIKSLYRRPCLPFCTGLFVHGGTLMACAAITQTHMHRSLHVNTSHTMRNTLITRIHTLYAMSHVSHTC